MKGEIVTLNNQTAEAVADQLRQHGYPDARAVQVELGFGVSVSPDRYIILDPVDIHESALEVIEGIMKKAKGGDIEAAEWLDRRGLLMLPTKNEDQSEGA